MQDKPIVPISSLFGKTYEPEVKTKKTEFGDLLDYFYNLDIQTKKGRLSRGAIGLYISPFIRGTKDNRNYSLLYILRNKCEESKNPCAVFWSYVRRKKQ